MFLTEFGPTALRLMQQKIVTEKENARSAQSAWGALLRSSANQHSGLTDIRKVSCFKILSDEEREKQYRPYQESLKGLVTCIMRAYNAMRYEKREKSNIPEGAEYDHILYFNPGEQLMWGQQHTMFQRGGTTADSILRMTRKNIALQDKAVKKMHTNMYTNQLTRIKSYIHDGWPEELELPESTSGAGLKRLDLCKIFTEDLCRLGLLLNDDDPGAWTPGAERSAAAAPSAAAVEGDVTEDTSGAALSLPPPPVSLAIYPPSLSYCSFPPQPLFSL